MARELPTLTLESALSDPDLRLHAFSYAFLHEFFTSIAAQKSSVVQFFITLGAIMKTMNKTMLVIFALGAMLQSTRSSADFADIPLGGKLGIVTTAVIAGGIIARPPPYGLWSLLPVTEQALTVEVAVDAAEAGLEAESLGTVAAASEAGSATTTTAAGATAATVGLVVIAVVVVVAIVAMATISLWLPPILKQSGVANSTLYEVDAYIDFQGAVGSSCSRAHLVMYPYSRKDLGAPWRVVGGDRGRACIPERYGARVDIPARGSLVQFRGSIKDTHKNIKKIGLEAPTSKRKGLHFIWSNA